MANCFICNKITEQVYLCELHANELYKMLKNKERVIENPDWKVHCLICGEYENRIIVDYPNAGPFCDKDIIESKNSYLI
jgi:hypothetical protein